VKSIVTVATWFSHELPAVAFKPSANWNFSIAPGRRPWPEGGTLGLCVGYVTFQTKHASMPLCGQLARTVAGTLPVFVMFP